jgi:hypothetical protein
VWGDSEFGKLGYGQEAPCKIPEKLKTIRGDKVVHVVCGAHNTAFIGGKSQDNLNNNFKLNYYKKKITAIT